MKLSWFQPKQTEPPLVEVAPVQLETKALAPEKDVNAVVTTNMEQSSNSLFTAPIERLTRIYNSESAIKLRTPLYDVLSVAFTAFFVLFYAAVIGPLSCIVYDTRQRLKIQYYCFRPVEFLLHLLFERMFELKFYGDTEADTKTSLTVIVCNHKCLLDYLMMHFIARNRKIHNSTFFFAWKHCFRLPTLRVLYNMWRKESNWRVPDLSLQETFVPIFQSPAVDDGAKWLIVFPEVSPWSKPAAMAQHAHCYNHGCPKLINLLYPRFNAFSQAVTFMREDVGFIYDFTVVYQCRLDGQIRVPSIKELIFSQQDWIVHICMKRYSAQSFPYKEKHLQKWLEQRWYNKDAALTEFLADIDVGADPLVLGKRL